MKNHSAISSGPLIVLLTALLLAVGLPILASSAEAKAGKSDGPAKDKDKGKENNKTAPKDKAKDKNDAKPKAKEMRGKASDLATNPTPSPKSEKKKDKQPPVKSSGDITVLREAYNTLTLGMHVYEGHRRRAITHIDKAGHALGTDFKGDAGRVSSRLLSDAQLLAVKAILEKTRARFTGEALEQVDLAIKELGVALSLPKK
jgi:hypothetical protein